MRTSVLASVAVLLLCASAVAGADINGKWRAQVPWPGKNLTDFTFTFKVDGAKLTGTAAYPLGDNAYRMDIIEGKVDGDSLSFVVVTMMRNTESRQTYKGTVVGDVINFTLSIPPAAPPAGPPPAAAAGAPPPAGPVASGPQVVEFTAKR